MIRFLTEVRGELVKVTYPSREEVIRMTAIVIAISLIAGLYMGALDYLFLNGLQFLIK